MKKQYRDYLSNSLQVVYDSILDLITSEETNKATISCQYPKHVLERVLNFVYYDYPEFYFYITDVFFSKIEEESIEVIVGRIPTKKALLVKHVNEITTKIDNQKNKETILQSLFDVLLDTYTYSDTNDLEKYQLSCVGFSALYQYILRQYNIECLYVEGLLNRFNSRHAWNLLECDNEWLAVDISLSTEKYRILSKGKKFYLFRLNKEEVSFFNFDEFDPQKIISLTICQKLNVKEVIPLTIGNHSILYLLIDDKYQTYVLKQFTDHLVSEREKNNNDKLKDIQGLIHPIDSGFENDIDYTLSLYYSPISKERFVSITDIKHILLGVYEILYDLRNNDYIYGDIKPGNIYFDDKHNVVLGDLESVHKACDDLFTGTYLYMSPTVFKEKKSSYRGDLVSLLYVIVSLLSNYELPSINYFDLNKTFEDRIKTIEYDIPYLQKEIKGLLKIAFSKASDKKVFQKFEKTISKMCQLLSITDTDDQTIIHCISNEPLAKSVAISLPAGSFRSSNSINDEFDDTFLDSIFDLELEDKSDIKEGKKQIGENHTPMVNYSLVSEKEIKINSNFTIDFMMYIDEYAHVVDKVIEGYKEPSIKEGVIPAKTKSEITLRLHSPNLPSLFDEETFIWNGEYNIATLSGFVDKDYQSNNLLLIVDVIINGIKVTAIKTTIDLISPVMGPLSIFKEDVKRVFFSYSSLDRDVVFDIVNKTVNIIGQGIDFFVDVLKLRAGDDWQKRIYQEIDSSDSFCLIWSFNAYKSKWVKKEWEYALNKKGISSFNPINISPNEKPKVPIPKKLNKIHFANYDALNKFGL